MEKEVEFVTLAEKGRVAVPLISRMSDTQIDNEISSYCDEDLLNEDTRDRLGRLRIESTPMAAMRLQAKEAVKKRLLERRIRSKAKVA